jgi:hypothetical protein
MWDEPTIHSSSNDPAWPAFLDAINATNALVAVAVSDCALIIAPRERRAVFRFDPIDTFNARLIDLAEHREILRAAVERVYGQPVRDVAVEVVRVGLDLPPLTWTAERDDARQTIEVRGATAADIPVVESFLRGLSDAGYRVQFTGRYADYLGSEYWRESRRRVSALERAEHRCAVCNAAGQLDVHHRTYERLGYESSSDLIALCRRCHRRHHMR